MDEILQNAFDRLQTEDVIQIPLGDLVSLIPEAELGYEVDEFSMQVISEALQSQGMDSEPRVRKGIIKRALDSKLFLYKSDRTISIDSTAYKNALLFVRMAVLMAKVDGKATDEELVSIKSLIWGMNYLTSTQKSSLYARAMYLMDSAQKYDIRARDYVRAALDRQKLIELVEGASDTAAALMIEVAKSIAVADGFIERSELVLLQDMYKARGLSARSTKSDLEEYARDEYVDIKTRDEATLIPPEEFDEVADILGDLLLDFDDF